VQVSTLAFTPCSGGAAIPSSAISLAMGDNVLVIRVIAEDLVTTVDTLILIHRESTDAALATLTLTPSLPLFHFESDVLNYDLMAPSDMAQIEVQVLAHSALSSSVNIRTNGGALMTSLSPALITTCALNVGDNMIEVIIWAEDGVTTSTYTLHLHRISTVSSLASLVLTPSLGHNFNAAAVESITVPSSLTSLTLTTRPTHHLAHAVYATGEEGGAVDTIELMDNIASGPISLLIGTTSIVITVMAEDGITTTVHTLLLHRPSMDCTLAGFNLLPVGLQFAPEFHSAITTYTTTVPHAQSTASFAVMVNHDAVTAVRLMRQQSDSTWQLVESLNRHGASSVQSLPVGDTVWSVEIVAEDAISLCRYTAQVTRLSNDAAADALTLTVVGTGANLDTALTPQFAADRRTYTLNVPNAVRAITAQLHSRDPTAKVKYVLESTASRLLGLHIPSNALAYDVVSSPLTMVAGINFLTLTVTSGDDSKVLTYDLTITRAADLTAITLRGLPNTLTVPTAPLFTPGQPRLNSAVDYKVEQICILSTYITPHPDWKLLNEASRAAVTLSSGGGGICSDPMSLMAGQVNFFSVVDPVDPTQVNITITRAAPVLTSIVFSVLEGAPLYDAPSPAFASNHRVYSGSTVFRSSAIVLLTSFTSGTMSLTISNQQISTSMTIVSGVSVTLPLTVGGNLIELTHSLDGIYTYTITRAQPNVNGLRLDGVLSDDSIRTGLVISPTFEGGVMSYTAAVPLDVQSLIFVPTFLTTGSLSITLTDATGPSTTVLTSGQAMARIPLPGGNSLYALNSTYDGSYIIAISRSAADVGGIVLRGTSIDGHTEVFTLVPSFIPGDVMTERIVHVAKTFVSFSLLVTFHSARNESTVTAASQSLVSAVASTQVPLVVGPNTLTVESSDDGAYSFVLHRAAADIRSHGINGVYQDGIITPLVLTPATFIVTTDTYTVEVPYRTHTVTFHTEFETAGTVSLSGGSLGAAFLPMVSGVQSVPLDIVVGSNAFTITSILDGTFNMIVTRAPPDVSAVNVQLTSSTAATWVDAPLPSFDSRVYTYAVTVPHASHQVTLLIDFVTPSTVVLSIDDLPHSSFASGLSRTFDLPIGTTRFMVTSQLDGRYEFTMTRLPMDLTALAASGCDADGTFLTAPAVPIALTPPFSTPVFAYTLIVGSKVRALALTGVFNTQRANIVIVTPMHDVAQVQTLVNGERSATFPLPVGHSIFSIASLLDGEVTITVTRELSDLVAWRLLDAADATMTPLPFVPSAFQPDVTSYTLNVPFRVEGVVIEVDHQHDDSALTLQSGGQLQPAVAISDRDVATGYVTSRLVTTSLVPRSFTPVALHLHSRYDANVSLSVNRAAPVVGRLQMQVRTLSAGVGGFEEFVSLAASALQPIFNSAQRDYTLQLPFTDAALRIVMEFTAGTVSLSMGGIDATPIGLTSGVLSSDLPLSVGSQLLTIDSSEDGVYRLVIIRAAPSVSSLLVSTAARTNPVVHRHLVCYSRRSPQPPTSTPCNIR
jgi:hypothetical protein